MEFFVNPEDLQGWVKSRSSANDASKSILDIIGKGDETDVSQTCEQIFNGDEKASKDASDILFGVLAKNDLAKLSKTAGTIGTQKCKCGNEGNKNSRCKNCGKWIPGKPISEWEGSWAQQEEERKQKKQETAEDTINMKKEAEKQVPTNAQESRQRNNWVRGNRNKWNRVVDGFNEGTPWRIDRDKFFNFTHYYTDALSFDEDPNRVYSGEAIWRKYIMDKFTTEHQTKEGKWVGGYINDRFYVFPDAGTPSNPDVPRDGGNQMGLPPGTKSRKPRPHQYSTERRLEEARGAKTYDIEAFAAQTTKTIKIASASKSDIDNDKIYSIFRDVLDMREAGISYETMLEEVAKHYNSSIMGVANIDKVAQALKTKHAGIAYSMTKTAKVVIQPNGNYVVANPIKTQDGQYLQKDTDLVATGRPNEFTISYSPDGAIKENMTVVIAGFNEGDLLPSGQETGIVGDETQTVNMAEYPDHTFQGAAKQASPALEAPADTADTGNQGMEDLGPVS